MIFVGIGITKKKHFATMDPNGQIILEPFSFNNNIHDFSLLNSKIKAFNKKEIIIRMESTIHYAENLIFFFLIYAINLLLLILSKLLILEKQKLIKLIFILLLKH